MIFWRAIAILGLYVTLLFTAACDSPSNSSTKSPVYTVADTSNYKILFGTVCTEVKIKVTPPVSKEALEALLHNVLAQQYDKATPIGRPEFFKIRAYYDNDPKLERQVGAVYQGTPNGTFGRIAFEYNNEVTYDREIEKPVLSREEKARQEEVGKFAGDLMEAARKAQGR